MLRKIALKENWTLTVLGKNVYDIPEMPGFPHIRKAACMFGWDWGPRLPDAGLFREAALVSIGTARLSQVHIRQDHRLTGKRGQCDAQRQLRDEEHRLTGKREYGEQTRRKACKNIVEAVVLHVAAKVEWPSGIMPEKAKLSVTVAAPEFFSEGKGEDGRDRFEAEQEQGKLLHVESPLKDFLPDSMPSRDLAGLGPKLRSSHLDIWPVASWASVDYYGNWKALQYAEKRMFAPVLLSCEEHGEIDQKPFVNTLPREIDVSADLHVANETAKEVRGVVNWSLRMPDSSVVREGSFPVTVPAFDGVWLPHLDFHGEDPLKVHLYFELLIGGEPVSSGTALFCAPKHYGFLDPKLSVAVEGDTVTVKAENFAKYVSVETEEGVLRLDENFVDVEAGTRVFRILPGRDFTLYGAGALEGTRCKTWADGAKLSGAYRVRSVYEMAER